MALNRDSLISALKTGIVDVNYTKVSGEEATIRATLKEALLPATKGTGKAANPEVLNVVDVNKNAWRSIRVANVKSYAAV